MTNLLGFAFIGLGAGAVYAALGLGIVVMYKATGVINFAAGALGAWSAYVYTGLRTSGDLVLPVVFIPARIHLAHQLPVSASLIIATGTALVLGLIVYGTIFRPLRNAPMLAKIVASAGVMIAIQPLIALRFGVDGRIVAPILPQSSMSVGGVAVTTDRLWLAVIVIVITVLIAAWLRLSTTGLAMRAAAESEFFVSLARFAPGRLAALAWALSSCIVGAISVLAAPMIGLDATSYTLLVVPALACALAGRLTSIGWTVAAGLTLGIVNAEITDLSGRTWWPSWAASGAGYAIPFVAVVALLIVLGRSLPTRDIVNTSKLPAVPRPRFRPVYVTALSAAGVAALLLTTGSYRFGVITSMIYAIMALSFVVLTGLLGQVSFAQAVLAGTAGFVLSKLSTDAHIGFPWAPLLATAAATVLGLLAGIPALRIRGVQLAVVTLAAAVAIEQFVFGNTALVGIENLVPDPRLFGLDLGVRSGTDTARLQFGIFCLVVLILAGISVSNLTRSATGRRFLAVRSNERASAAVGVDVVRTKLLGFAFSSFFAGLSGCLIGYSQGSLSVASFTTLVGVSLLMFAYLGGITSANGALVAGTFAPLGLGFVLADHLVGASSDGYQLFAAIMLIFSTIINPEGIAGKASHDLKALRDRLRRHQRAAAAPAVATSTIPHLAAITPAGIAASAPAPDHHPVLTVDHITVRFAGVTAVDDVSLQVQAGQIVGLIGANGAGKTTLIDAIGGFVPHSGGITLNGQSLHHLAPHRRARRGLARTWQSVELFGDLTVRENLLLAAEKPSPFGTLIDLAHPNRTSADKDPDSILDSLGLGSIADRSPAELSLGQRKLANLARALAGRPSMLLLDEPAAGLSHADTRALSGVLRTFANKSIGILLVEHDIAWVLELCDVIYALDFGRVIAQGPPSAIRNDPAVLAAYLGRSDRTDLDTANTRSEPLR
jgi:ABC-type branched-subunit amino acid transport system ATPase component/branched-subunit amino acid ABC-type transport system permease component